MIIAEYIDIPLNIKAGGIGTYIKSLTEEFIKLGHNVVIIDGTYKPKFILNRHMIKLCKAAYIHHFNEPSTLPIMPETLRNFKSIKIVVTFHAPVSNKVLRGFYDWTTFLLYKRALVITTSKRNAEYLKRKGINAYVIPLWSSNFFRPATSNYYQREPYILSVCVVDKKHWYKNFPMLSKLGKILKEKFNVTLVHVGPHDFNLPWVYHYGPVDRQTLLHLYQKALMLILPSIGPYEGFGIVAAEALSCGTPVLVSDGAGISCFLDSCFVSSLQEFEEKISVLVKELLYDPRPLIDKAYQESLKFSYENCRKTVRLILSFASKDID
jgi:glycosyltransferase involved in cell wall biosynthesis